MNEYENKNAENQRHRCKKLKKQAIDGRQYKRREYQSSHHLKGKDIFICTYLLTIVLTFLDKRSPHVVIELIGLIHFC